MTLSFSGISALFTRYKVNEYSWTGGKLMFLRYYFRCPAMQLDDDHRQKRWRCGEATLNKAATLHLFLLCRSASLVVQLIKFLINFRWIRSVFPPCFPFSEEFVWRALFSRKENAGDTNCNIIFQLSWVLKRRLHNIYSFVCLLTFIWTVLVSIFFCMRKGSDCAEEQIELKIWD